MAYSLSTKLLEYVAMGVPVVATDLRTFRAHFDGSAIRYVPGNDPWALAGAIADLALDPPAAAAQAAEASRQARPTPGPSRRTGTWPLSGNSWRAVDSGRRAGRSAAW